MNTSERAQKIKELSQKNEELNQTISTLSKKKKAIEREIGSLERKKFQNSERKSLLEAQQKDPVVLDHAIVRYLERIKNIDVEGLAQEILPDEYIEKVKTIGEGYIPIEKSHVLVIKGNKVITVLNQEELKRKESRRKKTRRQKRRSRETKAFTDEDLE